MIAADAFAPEINGAAHFAVRLAAGLAGRGHDVHVLCPSDAGPVFTEMSGPVTVHRIRSHRAPTHASFRFATPWHADRAVSALVEQLRPDVVHVQAHFVIGRAAAAAAARLRIPLVATNHFMPRTCSATCTCRARRGRRRPAGRGGTWPGCSARRRW